MRLIIGDLDTIGRKSILSIAIAFFIALFALSVLPSDSSAICQEAESESAEDSETERVIEFLAEKLNDSLFQLQNNRVKVRVMDLAKHANLNDEKTSEILAISETAVRRYCAQFTGRLTEDASRSQERFNLNEESVFQVRSKVYSLKGDTSNQPQTRFQIGFRSYGQFWAMHFHVSGSGGGFGHSLESTRSRMFDVFASDEWNDEPVVTPQQLAAFLNYENLELKKRVASILENVLSRELRLSSQESESVRSWILDEIEVDIHFPVITNANLQFPRLLGNIPDCLNEYQIEKLKIIVGNRMIMED